MEKPYVLSGSADPPRHRNSYQQLFEDNALILVIRKKRKLGVKKRKLNEHRIAAISVPCSHGKD